MAKFAGGERLSEHAKPVPRIKDVRRPVNQGTIYVAEEEAERILCRVRQSVAQVCFLWQKGEKELRQRSRLAHNAHREEKLLSARRGGKTEQQGVEESLRGESCNSKRGHGHNRGSENKKRYLVDQSFKRKSLSEAIIKE